MSGSRIESEGIDIQPNMPRNSYVPKGSYARSFQAMEEEQEQKELKDIPSSITSEDTGSFPIKRMSTLNNSDSSDEEPSESHAEAQRLLRNNDPETSASDKEEEYYIVNLQYGEDSANSKPVRVKINAKSKLGLTLAAAFGAANALNTAFTALGGPTKTSPKDYSLQWFLDLLPGEKYRSIASATASLTINTVMNYRFNVGAIQKLKEGWNESRLISAIAAAAAGYGSLPSLAIALASYAWAPYYVSVPLSLITAMSTFTSRVDGIINLINDVKDRLDKDMNYHRIALDKLSRFKVDDPEINEIFQSKLGSGFNNKLNDNSLTAVIIAVNETLFELGVRDVKETLINDFGLNEGRLNKLLKEKEDCLVPLEPKDLFEAMPVDATPSTDRKRKPTVIIEHPNGTTSTLNFEENNGECLAYEARNTFSQQRFEELIKDHEKKDEILNLITQRGMDKVFRKTTTPERVANALKTTCDATIGLSVFTLALVVFTQKGVDGLLKLEELLNKATDQNFETIKNLPEYAQLLAGLPSGLINAIFYGKNAASTRSVLLQVIKSLTGAVKNLSEKALNSLGNILGNGSLGYLNYLASESMRSVGLGIINNKDGVWNGILFPDPNQEFVTPEQQATFANAFQVAFKNGFPDMSAFIGALINSNNTFKAFNDKMNPIKGLKTGEPIFSTTGNEYGTEGVKYEVNFDRLISYEAARKRSEKKGLCMGYTANGLAMFSNLNKMHRADTQANGNSHRPDIIADLNGDDERSAKQRVY